MQISFTSHLLQLKEWIKLTNINEPKTILTDQKGLVQLEHGSTRLDRPPPH